MSRVAVLGDLNLDIIMFLEKEPLPDTSESAAEAYVRPGGVGGNISSWLSRLEDEPVLLAAVGEDALGEELLNQLRKFGISAKAIKRVKGSITGIMVSMMSPSGKKIVGFRGANSFLQYSRRELVEFLRECSHAHASGYESLNRDGGLLLLNFLTVAKELHITTSIDLEGISTSRREFVNRLKGIVDYIFLNREELRALIGDDYVRGVKHLGNLTGAKAVALKMGADGALLCLCKEDKTLKAPAETGVFVVDPTGAGDAFNAGFIHGITRKLSPKESLVFAVSVGSEAVSVIGAWPPNKRST
jgi:sugar/nucleoside kinase (ribokinase family)